MKKQILHNYGWIRQLNIAVGVSYGTDVNVALGLVEEILDSNFRVLKNPMPVFEVARLAESGITISVSP